MALLDVGLHVVLNSNFAKIRSVCQPPHALSKPFQEMCWSSSPSVLDFEARPACRRRQRLVGSDAKSGWAAPLAGQGVGWQALARQGLPVSGAAAVRWEGLAKSVWWAAGVAAGAGSWELPAQP